MESSDYIAISAIIATGIVAYIGHLTNKENIKARLSEIAFEKRLEAFREIVEKCGVLKRLGSRSKVFSSGNKERMNIYEKELRIALEDFYNVYQKQRVYFPPSIEKIVNTYGNITFDFVKKQAHTTENTQKWFKNIQKKEKELVTEIQKFIGFS